MKHRLSISLVLTLTLTTGEWRISNKGKLTTVLPMTAMTLDCTLVREIFRDNNSRQTTEEKLLCPRNTLQPASRVSALVTSEINCDDRQNGCHDSDPRGPRATRDTPDIISPYDTDIIDSKPSLSWYSVEGAISYTASVIDMAGLEKRRERQFDASTFTSRVIRIDYPFTEALQPGGRYKLVVEARTLSTEKRVLPGESRFRLLSQEEARQVEAEALSIRNNANLSNDEKALKIAEIYEKKDLIDAAIKILKDVVQNNSKAAQVYRTLGRLYWQQGLLNLAQPQYKKAVELTTNAEELKSAKDRLNRINAEIERQGKAIP